MLNTKYQSSMPSTSEEKNFEDEILCSYVPFCDLPHRVGPILTPGASSKHLNKLGRGPLEDAKYEIPNMKALALTVWEKKIFKNFLLYLYVKSENPQHRTNFYSRAII